MTAEQESLHSRSQRKLEGLGLAPIAHDLVRSAVQQAQIKLAPVTHSIDITPSDQRDIVISGQTDFYLDIAALKAKTNFATIIIENCHRFCVQGGDTVLEETSGRDDKRLILLRECSQFSLIDLCVKGGRNAITLDRCRSFLLEDIAVQDVEGYGITVLHSNAGKLLNCCGKNCLASGINIIGACHRLHIQDCKVARSRGSYNWDAGINVMHCTHEINLDAVPEACHEAVDLTEKRATPHLIWIDNCEISGCTAQGVYLEGAAQVLVEHCFIHDNNKEGLCLDWGTGLSHIRHCVISRNGERANYNDERCRIDFLPVEYRDTENRHYCQLPGISIDNGYGNLIEFNTLCGNYGGGVKIVRSSFKNRIAFNTLVANRPHHADEIAGNPYRVSEIKILAMGVGSDEFDDAQHHLDFLEPKENEFIGNRLLPGDSNCENRFAAWNQAAAKRSNTIEI